MRALILAGLIVLTTLLNGSAAAATVGEALPAIGQRHLIQSEQLGETREYYVALPRSYRVDGATRYPVLLMLDADFQHFFPLFASMAAQMASDATPLVPEMIVVGVVSQQRVRDSTPTASRLGFTGQESALFAPSGGSERFLRFLRDELLPEVERRHRSNGHRVLFGYSLTGLTVVQALMSTPETFKAYVAADPSLWWDSRLLQRRLEAGEYCRAPGPRRLFISATEHLPDGAPPGHFNHEFLAAFESRPIPGVNLGRVIYGPQENHGTLPIRSFYDGLRHAFEGYKLPDWTEVPAAAELERHFAGVAQRLGGPLLPREDLLNWLGYEKLMGGQFKVAPAEAVALFELNTRYYPQSANAWDSLGEGLERLGEPARALQAYRRALALNPAMPSALAAAKRLAQPH